MLKEVSAQAANAVAEVVKHTEQTALSEEIAAIHDRISHLEKEAKRQSDGYVGERNTLAASVLNLQRRVTRIERALHQAKLQMDKTLTEVAMQEHEVDEYILQRRKELEEEAEVSWQEPETG